MRKYVSIVIGVTAALASAGCWSLDRRPDVSITLGRTGPLDAGLTASRASVPAGVALELTVQPYYSSSGTISVKVGDPTVASVVPMTSPTGFLLIGIAPGVTPLHFFMDGNETTALWVEGTQTSTLDAEVTMQPAR